MRAGTAILALGVLVAAWLGTGSAFAGCDDRPGTPNALAADTLSPTSIRLSWTNTTGRAAAGSGSGHTMYFDVYVRGIHGQDTGHGVTGDGPYPNITYGSCSFREFGGLAPGTDYCFSMRARDEAGTQGCISRFASATVCAATWVPPGTDPNMCKSGFVWRTATPADAVCVTPEVRAQTLADNKQARQRRTGPPIFDPSRCPLGNHKATQCWRHDVPCVPGYVWREAAPGDYVCVPPETRAQAWRDNERAVERKVLVATAGAAPPPPPCMAPGSPPPEVARTCGGQPATFATQFTPVYYDGGDGCAKAEGVWANSPAEARQCGRAKYGDAFEETIVVLRVAATGPNGCRVFTIQAGNEDKAVQCANALCGAGCESEVGECP